MRLTADYPPVWLIGFLGIAWALGRIWPHGPTWLALPGWLSIAAGLVLMLLAALRMWRHRTTVDPHGQPRSLVTDGVFALSRNPIYLGDAMILLGAALVWSAPLGLLLVPVFAAVIHRRFIRKEETALQRLFPVQFATYRSRTRRWI